MAARVSLVRWILLLGSLVAAGACRKAPPAQPEFATTATIKDIMDAMVDPSADFLFDSVAMIADERGVTEKAPQTDEEWKEVRRRAIQILGCHFILAQPSLMLEDVVDVFALQPAEPPAV